MKNLPYGAGIFSLKPALRGRKYFITRLKENKDFFCILNYLIYEKSAY